MQPLFDPEMFIQNKPPMVDISIAVHLCLRAAQYSYHPEDFRMHIQTAHIILDALNMAGDYLPNRYDSRVLYQKTALDFIRDSVLAAGTFSSSRRSLLTRLRTISVSTSTSESTSISESETFSGGSTYEERFLGLGEKVLHKTKSSGESKTKTTTTGTSTTTQTAMDGKNIRFSDLLSGYERILQNVFSDSFLQYFMRYHRASQSRIFIQKVENVGVQIWRKYLEWWLAAYDSSERQSIVQEAAGQQFEIAPQEVFAATITVRPAYRSFEGWILEHLAAPYSGYPNPQFLRMLIGLADAYRAETVQDIYGVMKELHDWLERSKELDTFIGDIEAPSC